MLAGSKFCVGCLACIYSHSFLCRTPQKQTARPRATKKLTRTNLPAVLVRSTFKKKKPSRCKEKQKGETVKKDVVIQQQEKKKEKRSSMSLSTRSRNRNRKIVSVVFQLAFILYEQEKMMKLPSFFFGGGG